MALNNICLIGGAGFLGTSFRTKFGGEFNAVNILGRRPLIEGLKENESYYAVGEMSVDGIVDVLKKHRVNVVVDLSYHTVPKSSFENPVGDFSENLSSTINHLE